MEAKSVLYAAVGAPVVAARKVGDQMEAFRGRIAEERSSYTKAAEKALTDWAAEGEKVVTRISEGKVVEEISSKVDLDQAKEQVGKLRDQLEDMISTWRHSFRPEADEKAETKAPAKKPAAKKPAAKKAPAKKPAAKKTAAKSTAAKKPATKTSAAKTTKSSSAAKTSTAKSTATKAKSTS